MAYVSQTTYERVPSEDSVKLDHPIDLEEQHDGHNHPQASQKTSPGFAMFPWQRKKPYRFLDCVLLTCIILVILLGGLTSSRLYREEPTVETDALEYLLGPKIERQPGFTIVVPTYKRPQMLPRFLEHYATGNVPSLARIVFLWHDNATDPPNAFMDSLNAYSVPIVVERRDISLNQRFQTSENILTNCVMTIDDDMRYDTRDIEMGYQAWEQFGQGRKRMVGYIAREVVDRRYSMEKLKTYSMVLTKSAFFHADWMKAYWSTDKQMTELRGFVDSQGNCEDILMAFLHSRHTRLPPLQVIAPYANEGFSGGTSDNIIQLETRTECVRHFLDVLGEDTPVSNSISITRFES